MLSQSLLLSQLIDDYIAWFTTWHRLTSGDQIALVLPPARFAAWREEAIKSFSGEQPAIERVTTLHDQLHTLVKLVQMKDAQGGIESKDDHSITVKYMELILELRRFERAFAMAASDLDPLTGLRTRANLVPDLEREISRSVRTKRPFFVTIMDIDHFKMINDTHGHDAGDRVLASVADLVSRNLRLHDDAYRLGGEEFLLCLKETDTVNSLIVVERLRRTLESTPVVLINGKLVSVTASFGITACTGETTPDALLKQADEALYRAKHEGRNRIVAA